MEDILNILIFAVVMIIYVWGSLNKKKKEAPKPKEVKPYDASPLDEIFANEVGPKPAAPVKGVTEKAKYRPKKQTPSIPTEEAKPKTVPQHTDGIRLSTHEDARRAFIYSEIFNRKY